MSRSQIFHSVFGFRTKPVTSLLIVIYSVVFIGVIVSDPVQKAPRDTGDLNLEQAYRDLHQIAARPRPFISHQNDNTRAFILSRLQNITQGFSHAHVVEDLSSNATWVEEGIAVSFEGTNLLVKVDGTDLNFADRGGVLFSAHYDSVSTGLGATDDAIGIVSMIAFVEYLCKVRTSRTAVFNFNNGEEDGLHGAHALLEHPWSTIPNVFINLEGAGAGGRPLLFRSTSLAPVSAFKNKDVPRPHGNVLSADVFSRGIIRSATDFEVYAAGTSPDTAMEGIDFAFYQRRSKYHTRYDSVPSADGGKDSIWAMLESLRGAGVSLLNNAGTHVEDGKPEPAVYFDMFGRSLVLFTQRGMFAFDVTMLILGPILLLFLHHLPASESSTLPNDQTQQPPTLKQRLLGPFHRRLSFKVSLRVRVRGSWSKTWRWLKFWAIFVFAIVFQVILVATMLSANRYIVQSRPFTVLISYLLLPALIIIFFTHLPLKRSGPCYPNQQRLTMLYQLYILAWILLVIGTALLHQLQIGGTYFLTGWYIFIFLAAVTGSLERIFRRRKLAMIARSQKHPHMPTRTDSPEEHGLQDQPVLASSSSTNNDAISLTRDDPDKKPPKPHERTPLISRKAPTEHQQEISSVGWWIFQLLLVTVIPVLLVSHLMMILIAALSQTLSDGSSPLIVYAGIAALSLLIVFPVVPFAFKIHRFVIVVGIAIFIIATIYNWTAFPFTQDVPLKVFFQQSVELQFSGNPSAPATTQTILHAHSTLTGVPAYIQSRVVSQLPSSWQPNANLECSSDSDRTGTSTCRWETDLIPTPAGLDAQSPWFTFSASKLNNTSALFTISGRSTRGCRLYFDNRNIHSYDVYSINSDGTQTPSNRPQQRNYEMTSTGVNEIRLWNRVWERNFTVGVSWDANDGVRDSGLSGRAACEWSEYGSGMIGMDVLNATTIPAYEEVLSFLPAWAVSTKTTDGLMEAWTRFSV